MDIADFQIFKKNILFEMKPRVYLGFKNDAEGQIYEDVCINILFPHALIKQDNQVYPETLPLVIKKDECLEIIKQNNLQDLFEEVFPLSRLERLKHIYVYYSNMSSLAFSMSELVYAKLLQEENYRTTHKYLKMMEGLENIDDFAEETISKVFYRSCILSPQDKENFTQFLLSSSDDNYTHRK